MPHVKAAPGQGIVNVDGQSVTEHDAINIDITKPQAAAALAASPPRLVQLDNVAAPSAATNQRGLPIPEIDGGGSAIGAGTFGGSLPVGPVLFYAKNDGSAHGALIIVTAEGALHSIALGA